jgi:methylenetetrahydrofolate--tRNA-(uracil-5-)-methyltransferase
MDNRMPGDRMGANVDTQRTATIVGAGLAGSEAAWQLARRGVAVTLREMRPHTSTPAHQTGDFAELVCSNSLKSESGGSASFLLKEELRRLHSLLLAAAEPCRVPAGQALAVDRVAFARQVTATLESMPGIRIRREEATVIPPERPLILATGPLTGDALAEDLHRVAGDEFLYFYDAISPIVAADSIDNAVAFPASRYGKGGEDYLNCPFTPEEYLRFYEALTGAESYPLREFEQTMFFEGCLPVEELARRGVDTLRFGPMKPVGLTDPRTGRPPYAAVQLRRENLLADAYNLVGFQNHLRFGEQERVFRLIPGLEEARFLRFGQIHRNTYLNAPAVLSAHLELQSAPGVFVAGQLCGLEGYVEAIATGMLAALQVLHRLEGRPPLLFPRGTALGSLQHALVQADPANYQPVNMTLALLPPVDEAFRRRHRVKSERHRRQVADALALFDEFARTEGLLKSGE